MDCSPVTATDFRDDGATDFGAATARLCARGACTGLPRANGVAPPPGQNGGARSPDLPVLPETGRREIPGTKQVERQHQVVLQMGVPGQVPKPHHRVHHTGPVRNRGWRPPGRCRNVGGTPERARTCRSHEVGEFGTAARHIQRIQSASGVLRDSVACNRRNDQSNSNGLARTTA